MKGDDDASDVEECTTECEAEFMQAGYEKLCEELRERVEEIGVKESLRAVIGHESVVNGPARWNIETCSDRELDGFLRFC
ncbi:hypothetical protein [Rubritalea profundi]|nr:hypothetical protein [Rubritalea profundi]